ncbi:MAG: GntR family transcriptional regulator [Chloroflexi bacterium]|nr:MAG: GntR family transcriptional regulator [Chloroflexota bacterium]MBL1193803.1 GntR family transcriptional regulator [Chloroflexota bacterium]NOH11096.1 GntR family transcriptional regulator [Chloroflexota bacterium]
MNQLFLKMLETFQSDEFKAGAQLPAYGELATRFDASEDEIKRVISELIYEGVIERTRPEPKQEAQIPSYQLWGVLTGSHSITKEAKKRGLTPGVEIINWEKVVAWPSIGERLDLEVGKDEVQIMERLRSAESEPVGIETSYFPAKHYPGVTKDLFTGGGTGQSSFKVMEEKFGIKSARATDEVTVVCLEKREADYLQLAEGTPVLLRFRVTYSDKDIPVKASRAVWKFRAKWEMDL